jgi:hypothetical protein
MLIVLLYQSLLTSASDVQSKSSYQNIFEVRSKKMNIEIKIETFFLHSILKILYLHIPKKKSHIIPCWRIHIYIYIERERERERDTHM